MSSMSPDPSSPVARLKLRSRQAADHRGDASTIAALTPITVGTMALDHRIVVPPHSGGGGRLLDSGSDFERHVGYWKARVDGGVQWVGGGPTFVRNPLIPGFEPTGVGSNGPGFFRHPMFVDRMGEYMRLLHGAGGFGSVQFVLQGGMPIAPSATFSGYSEHRVPHVLDADEIAWLIREYGESAALAAEAGADVLELHANHDDVLQWFLSPLTNRRTDAYGGSFHNRRSFLREVVESMRSHVDRSITLGLRLCLDEMIEGGYAIDECQRLISEFTTDGTVDYFSLDVGGNWGPVSYIQPGVYREAQWAELCGQAKQATHLPVVYVGRVADVAAAATIIADGHADLVGMARAMIADPELVNKTRSGQADRIRPCIGANDCIDRRVVEGLEFACSANPFAGREYLGEFPRTKARKKILVIGAGPAGLEFAALATQRGHRVAVWERESQPGGQLALAAQLRMNGRYGAWIAWQHQRLDRLGVAVRFGVTADVASIDEHDPDVTVLATGAQPRFPDASGIDQPHVFTIAEAVGGAELGDHVLVVSEDDRAAPLAIADHLAGRGHRVTVAYRTQAPSPLVGKYTIGAILSRLDREGVQLVSMARLDAIDGSKVTFAHSYSDRRWTIEGIDSVVLACGAIGDDDLYRAVKKRRTNVHLLGDAYAPRRVVSATRQAWELAKILD
jgi:2,4-dienoyl-CoA reductase-like NADH-dependent reductase (Old Yellow Enzyme family)/thioredoxin reductase